MVMEPPPYTYVIGGGGVGEGKDSQEEFGKAVCRLSLRSPEGESLMQRIKKKRLRQRVLRH